MENQQRDNHEDEIEGEEFPEDFQCSVCLELFYKPVVLACGHIACFWCVFKSMDSWQQSHCMVCRYAYSHFPGVCKLLHYLLLKLYPLSYDRRKKQVSEEEKKLGHVSPQFDDYVPEMHVIKEIDGRKSNLPNSTVNAPKSGSLGEGEPSTSGISSKASLSEDSKINLFPGINCETTSKVAIQENIAKGNGITDGDCRHVLSSDLLCSLCKKLLCQPVVLNCGDVFCETCIINPVDKVPKCPVCHSAHPTGFPNVCLILEHFLESQFPEEYEGRKQSSAKQKDDHRVNQPTSWVSGQRAKVHFGVGCDYCGMCPIVGERYKCKHCVEKIGFDLCEQCYQGSFNLPGRFNQQHKEDHEFEKKDVTHIAELILSAESFEDAGSNDHEDTEENSQALVSSEDTTRDIEDGAALPSLNDTPENQQSSDSRT